MVASLDIQQVTMFIEIAPLAPTQVHPPNLGCIAVTHGGDAPISGDDFRFADVRSAVDVRESKRRLNLKPNPLALFFVGCELRDVHA